MNRRQLVASGASLLGIAALAACATTSSGVTGTIQQLGSDVALVDAGLTAALATIGQVPGISATTVAQVQTDLATIGAANAQVQAAVAAASSPASTVVQEVAAAVSALAQALLPLVPGGASFIPAIQAAQALMPVILAAVGISGVSQAAPAMAPAQARLVLRVAAK